MSFKKSFIVRLVILSIFAIASTASALAQTSTGFGQPQRKVMDIATGNNLYCAGFIQSGAISTGNKIIGGQDEADKFNYAQNDFVYINMGRDKGVNVGDVFAIVRPRGKVKSKWTKKSDVGFYVQEVGAVQVVNVKQEVAVARVKVSCDNILLGDLVEMVPQRTSPAFQKRDALDRFGDPSGKATGRILMARDGAEALARDFIAYVDLGADDNVRVGDHLTVFRPLAKGNITLSPDREIVKSRDSGFESQTYKGGKFSSASSRKSGEKADGPEVKTRDARKDRPANLRKVVGEAVVLNVKEKTATIVITRTGQEIHTGDWVEIQ